MRTLDQFLLDAAPYLGMFRRSENLTNYYSAVAVRSWNVAARLVRDAVKCMGYSNMSPVTDPDFVSSLRTVLGPGREPDMDEVCSRIPSDFIIHLPDGLLGTRLQGSFSLPDLFELRQGETYFVGKSSTQPPALDVEAMIFKDILVNYVVPSQRDAVGRADAYERIHRRFLVSDGRPGLTDAAVCFTITQFMRQCGDYLPGGLRAFYASEARDYHAKTIAEYLVSYDRIVLKNDVLCEHAFGAVTHYEAFSTLMGRLDGGGTFLKEFVRIFRLDLDSETEVSA